VNLVRHDYAHPLRVDIASGQVARAPYEQHVAQLIAQLLLTGPGERVCLPEFGCGLRRIVFAPQSEALLPTVRIQVQQSITRWLADQVQLRDVTVDLGEDQGLDQGAVLVTVVYLVLDTQTSDTVTVRVI
jgi:phage baseplate assembly protein W